MWLAVEGAGGGGGWVIGKEGGGGALRDCDRKLGECCWWLSW